MSELKNVEYRKFLETQKENFPPIKKGLQELPQNVIDVINKCGITEREKNAIVYQLKKAQITSYEESNLMNEEEFKEAFNKIRSFKVNPSSDYKGKKLIIKPSSKPRSKVRSPQAPVLRKINGINPMRLFISAAIISLIMAFLTFHMF
jgi:hypothetical protein